MKRYLLNISTVFLLLAVSACGFQLRGSTNIPASLQIIYVQGVNMQQGLGLELKRGLTRNGVTVLSDYQEGNAVLTILDNKFERRVLSVGSDAKVSEYELHGMVTFKVTDNDSQVLLGSERVEAQRDYQFDQNQVLGKGEEERLLKEQLNQQLVQTILRRLSVL
ncbi:MAG: hypothetical protein COA83_00825 [Methylophaga sp.]|nr:MAG: hypothetical protein COA83_00825 [Methylophaga sp.]